LQPLPPVFRVRTETSGTGSLDNVALKLDGNTYETSDLYDGPHTLTLSSRFAEKIHVEFETNAGHPPNVTKIESGQTLVIAVATLHDSGRLHASSTSLKIGVNGPADRLVEAGGIPLSDLRPGRNDIARDDGKDFSTESVDVGSQPALSIFVGSPTGGFLEIVESHGVDASVLVTPTEKKGQAIT